MEQILEYYVKITPLYRLIICLVLAAGIGYYSYGENIEPAQDVLDKAVAAKAALSEKIDAANKATQGSSLTEESVKKADEELALMFEKLPREPEIEKLLGSLAVTAKQSGVELQRYQPMKTVTTAATPIPLPTPKPLALAPVGALAPGVAIQPTPAPPTNTISAVSASGTDPMDELASKTEIQLRLTGTYPHLTSFLDRMLSLPRIVKIVKVDLIPNTSKPVGATSSPNLTADVVIITYTQKGIVDTPQTRLASAFVPPPAPVATPPTMPTPPASDKPEEKK